MGISQNESELKISLTTRMKEKGLYPEYLTPVESALPSPTARDDN